MKNFELLDIFELKYPDNWQHWSDKKSGLESFCEDSENAVGVLQVSFFTSKNKTFNAFEEQSEHESAEIITLNGNLTVYFDETKTDFKTIYWVTGENEIMLCLTYTFNLKSNFEHELEEVRKILTTLRIKTGT